MAKSKNRKLKMESVKCLIAFDAKSGDVLHVHEFMGESGTYQKDKKDQLNKEEIKVMTARDFEKRSIQVIRLPGNFSLKPDRSYWVDPVSCELREISDTTEMKFRDFIRKESEIPED